MSRFDDMVAAAGALAAPGLLAHADHPIAKRMAATAALVRCRIDIAMQDGTTAPRITITPAVTGHPSGNAVLAAIADAVETRFGKTRDTNLRDALGLNDTGGYAAQLILNGVDADDIQRAFNDTSMAIKALHAAIAKAACTHVAAVTKRDLGLGTGGESTNKVTGWALCRHLDGQPARSETIRRRLQALGAYGVVAGVLLETPITALIDEERPLAEALAARLGVDRARLARLNGRISAQGAMKAWRDNADIVANLALHDVALHRWDEECVNDAWRHHKGPLEPRFMATSGQRDAVTAFIRDVVKPLIQRRAAAIGMELAAQSFGASAVLAETIPLAARSAWLKALETALVGNRTAKSHQEASDRWHRRVASIAALRLEHTAPAPGWPALCEPWTSKDGRNTFTPLTTAQALVEEGTALEHCVGGYYEACRSGRTHILSHTVDGRKRTTLELLVSAGEKGVSIRQGQFEGLRRAKPDKEARQARDDFMNALQGRRHKIDHKLHAAYAKERSDAGYEYDRGDQLPPEYIRLAWPLHRPMLTRDAPADYDSWEATTPLVAAIDAALAAIAAQPPEGKRS